MTDLSRQVDVLVAGAGPAGSATAALLARSGISVLVVDRAAFPRDKACSEYMSPEAVRILARLGVVEILERAGAFPLEGMKVTGPRGVPSPSSLRAEKRRPSRGFPPPRGAPGCEPPPGSYTPSTPCRGEMRRDLLRGRKCRIGPEARPWRCRPARRRRSGHPPAAGDQSSHRQDNRAAPAANAVARKFTISLSSHVRPPLSTVGRPQRWTRHSLASSHVRQ